MKRLRIVLFPLLIIVCAQGYASLPIDGQIVRIEGEEALSTPYRFEVDIEAQGFTGNLVQLIDDPASFPLPGGRIVKGLVQSAVAVRRTQGGVLYRLVIAPRLADGGHVRRYRTFMEKTISDVARDIVSEMGQDFETDASSRTYEVLFQLGESDLNFLDRLLQRNGSYYFFDTANHKALFSENSQNAPSANVNLNMQGDNPSLTELGYGFAKHAGRVQLTSYEFKGPSNLAVNAQSFLYRDLIDENPMQSFTDTNEGNALANQDLQAHIAAALTINGVSSASAVAPGYTVMVQGHPVNDANQRYLIVSVQHEFRDGTYSNTFTAVPASIRYRPQRVTQAPEPTITRAVVVGPQGEDIHVDEYGRVRVALPWTEGSGVAPWARVVQPNKDSLWLPRIDDEVLVAFMHGDVNTPIVLGALFNGNHMPPYTLPDNKSIRSLASKTTPGEAFTNEIMMGDREESEVMRVNAARDLYTQAGNDYRVLVERDQFTEVLHNQDVNVGGDQQTAVAGNQQTSVSGKRHIVANSMEFRSATRIEFRVGDQTMVLDKNGIRLPAAPVRKPVTRRPVPQKKAVSPRPPKK